MIAEQNCTFAGLGRANTTVLLVVGYCYFCLLHLLLAICERGPRKGPVFTKPFLGGLAQPFRF